MGGGGLHLCVCARARVGAYICVRARGYARAALYCKYHAHQHFNHLNLDLVQLLQSHHERANGLHSFERRPTECVDLVPRASPEEAG